MDLGMLSSFADPHARHALLVHLPIVFGLLGIVPCLVFAATGFKSKAARVVCIAWFLVASAGAGVAAISGEEAEEGVEHSGLTAIEDEALEAHEELGEGGWIWPLIPAVLIGVTFVPKKQLRIGAGSLAVIASVGVAVWMAQTARLGGKLVYVYGLGVPERGAAVDGVLPSRGVYEDDDDDD